MKQHQQSNDVNPKENAKIYPHYLPLFHIELVNKVTDRTHKPS